MEECWNLHLIAIVNRGCLCSHNTSSLAAAAFRNDLVKVKAKIAIV